MFRPKTTDSRGPLNKDHDAGGRGSCRAGIATIKPATPRFALGRPRLLPSRNRTTISCCGSAGASHSPFSPGRCGSRPDRVVAATNIRCIVGRIASLRCVRLQQAAAVSGRGSSADRRLADGDFGSKSRLGGSRRKRIDEAAPAGKAFRGTIRDAPAGDRRHQGRRLEIGEQADHPRGKSPTPAEVGRLLDVSGAGLDKPDLIGHRRRHSLAVSRRAGRPLILVVCHSLNLGCHWLCQCSSLLTDQGKNSKITGRASGTQSQNQALTRR